MTWTPGGRRQGFLGLGSNAPDARQRLEQAVASLEREGVRVAAVSAPVRGPYVGPEGPDPATPPVLNAVAEIHAPYEAAALLARLHDLEARAGRVRDGARVRTLDLDLLDYPATSRPGREAQGARPPGAPALPHPRALERAFVLAPWEEIAPQHVVGTPQGAKHPQLPVLVHAARLRARDAAAFAALRTEPALALPRVGARPEVLATDEDLASWQPLRSPPRRPVVGLVPTMGALHAGHAALVRRARAVCDVVLATIFVNPLQFGPAEDLARYPRTFDADLEVLADAGADAVYAPRAEDLYPQGFCTHVVPEGPALPFEGALRPGHFRGVATVVLKLLLRSPAREAWFGQKDAQQVAVLRRMVRDLDLPTRLNVAPIVRDDDGLALSSRNRYLSAEERARARALPRALAGLVEAVARGERDAALLCTAARETLESAGLGLDYLALVDPDALTPVPRVGAVPALALAAVRAGTTRLLDNRWVVAP